MFITSDKFCVPGLGIVAQEQATEPRLSSPIRMLPLNALRSFDAAARHLSFTAAAAELGVTPAAVSVQVRRLEEWVGAPLFARGHRSIVLSATGRRLAPRLTALFVEMERLVSEVADLDAATLQVSAMPTFASKWVAPRLASFIKHRPNIQVRIVGSDRRSDFDRDGVDIGLRYGDGDFGDLHAELIATATAFPVCSPALAAECGPDPLRIESTRLLQDESSLVAPGLPTWTTWFAKAGVERVDDNAGPLFSNSHMAMAAAVAGQGFALGLSPLVDDDLAAGRLVKPFATEVASPFGFWFVCRKDRLQEPKIAAFREWLFEQAGPDHSRSPPHF
jgi:LysR family transcriptional regulator, glycine cleavage system transcriptional activator